MRHKLAHRKLNRTSEHRKALFKNMLCFIFWHSHEVNSASPVTILRFYKMFKFSKKLRLFKGRSSKGIKGIKLNDKDKVISISILKIA